MNKALPLAVFTMAIAVGSSTAAAYGTHWQSRDRRTGTEALNRDYYTHKHYYERTTRQQPDTQRCGCSGQRARGVNERTGPTPEVLSGVPKLEI